MKNDFSWTTTIIVVMFVYGAVAIFSDSLSFDYIFALSSILFIFILDITRCIINLGD
ncbi:MAG: hypothetical protein ACTSX6_04585 [Candidatus Heimdallarchaeaceae archaeon]